MSDPDFNLLVALDFCWQKPALRGSSTLKPEYLSDEPHTQQAT